jgi:hypothetical protein
MGKRLKSLVGIQDAMLTLPVAASQTIVKGDLVAISSGKVIKAGAAATKVVGLAGAAITTGESPTAADVIPVNVIDGFTVLEFTYTGTFTDALMMSAAYDLTAAQVVDQADTTGGYFIPLSFNATTTKVRGVIKASALWNA